MWRAPHRLLLLLVACCTSWPLPLLLQKLLHELTFNLPPQFLQG
jgi:hypothetical protein